jgi:hypothetical protein
MSRNIVLVLSHMLHAGLMLGLFFDLKMEVTCSSENSVEFQRTTRYFIPEDIFITNAVKTAIPTC